MCKNLLELNPDDVKGNYVDQSVDEFVKTEWQNNFDLVIATDIDNEIALYIAEKANGTTPIVLIRQYGLIGYIRIILKEVAVAEQKKYQTKIQDLRLNAPFEELT